MKHMKKIVCLLTVLLLCMSLVVPVFATETGFVPSITYKPYPEIVPVPDAPEDTIGVVQKLDFNKQTATINVEMFGRETPVEISFAEVRKF